MRPKLNQPASPWNRHKIKNTVNSAWWFCNATPKNISTHCVSIEKRACLFSGRTAGKKVVRLKFMLSDWNVRPGTHIVQFGLHFNFTNFLFCSQEKKRLRSLNSRKEKSLDWIDITTYLSNYKLGSQMSGPPNFSFQAFNWNVCL